MHLIIEKLCTLLSKNRVVTDQANLQFYGKDRVIQFKPHPLAVCFPKTTAEVQAIVHLANQYGIKLVPSGGRTGYSGGAVAKAHELVVSFEKMIKF